MEYFVLVLEAEIPKASWSNSIEVPQIVNKKLKKSRIACEIEW